MLLHPPSQVGFWCRWPRFEDIVESISCKDLDPVPRRDEISLKEEDAGDILLQLPFIQHSYNVYLVWFFFSMHH